MDAERDVMVFVVELGSFVSSFGSTSLECYLCIISLERIFYVDKLQL
jgi:hypothetical protein